MFSKTFVATTVLALAATTAATMPASQCTTGPVQCCDSVESTITPVVSTVLALVGLSASDVVLPVGLTCSPISVVGVGSGATCSAEPVCCENNNFQGVISLGCSPVNLNL